MNHNSALLIEKQKVKDEKEKRRSFRRVSKPKPVIRMEEDAPIVRRAGRSLPPKSSTKEEKYEQPPLKKFDTQLISENPEEEVKESKIVERVEKVVHRDPMTEAEQFFSESEVEHFWDNHGVFKKKSELESKEEVKAGPAPKLKIA